MKPIFINSSLKMKNQTSINMKYLPAIILDSLGYMLAGTYWMHERWYWPCGSDSVRL
jgi:hypothetical protein